MNVLKSLVVSVVLILGLASAAMAAQGGEGNNTNCNGVGNVNSPCGGGGAGGAGGAGGSATSTSSAAAAASASANSTNINVNTQGQHQGQGQQQGQKQGQGQYQGQGQGQSYEGQQHTNVNFEGTKFDRYAPPVQAPGLTAAGTGVCLGSVSIGLSGPMAGASFGITKVDKGCEQRSAAALLYQMGYKDAAVRLLMKNEDVREALGTDAPKIASTEIKGVTQQVTVPDLTLSTVMGSEAAVIVAPSIPRAMATMQAERVSAVQGQ